MDLELNLSGIDHEKAESGVLIPYEGKIAFRIARAATPGYRKAVRKIIKLHKRQIDTGSLGDEESDTISANLMAEHILVGWEGMKNSEKDFPYTKANAVAFLSDPKYFHIRDWIMAQAQDIEHFREEDIKK